MPSALTPARHGDGETPARRSAFAHDHDEALLEARHHLLPSREDILRPFDGLPEDAKRRKLAARKEQLRRQAPTSLRAHTQLVHRTDTGEPQVAYRHHAEWCHIMEDPESFPYVVVSAPPGYAKSSWFTIAYATWRIGATGGNIRIGLIANTHSVARGFSGAIQDAITSPEFQAAYPTVKPDYDRAWRDTEWAVTGLERGPNFTLGSYGMNGPVQSRRFDEIILDDPTTEQQAWSKETLAKQKKWVRNTLLKRFPPGKRPPDGNGRMVVVLTRWAIDDLVPEFTRLGFHHINMPALGYWDRTAYCPDCDEWRDTELTALLQPCEHCGSADRAVIEYGTEPLWADLESAAQLAAQKEDDELMFELVMQGNPNVLSGDMFEKEWFQHGVPPALEEYDSTIVAVDTASGKNEFKGDWFALARLGVHGLKTWVDYIDRGRYNALEREDQVLAILGLEAVGRNGFRIVDERLWRNKPVALVIEDKGEGTDLIQRIRARHVPIRIVDAQASENKAYRASPLAGGYRNRQIWHPGWPDDYGELKVPKWVIRYEAEATAFPAGPHDDMVDAVAHAYNHIGDRGPRITSA